MKFGIETLCHVVNGQLLTPANTLATFESMSIDTRRLKATDCYVAIVGENFDGHDFVTQSIEQGAACVLVSCQSVLTGVDLTHEKTPIILVKDTRIAYGEFAHWYRNQMNLKQLIAVTGSNGKTTCKTMLASILSDQVSTLVTQGNLNNDYGVPQTLLSLTPEHEMAVIEMGANHRHEIQYLTRLAEPNVVLITNASGAHLEGFGSLQGVIETKGEIVEGLQAGGTAILNRDSAGFEYWLEKCKVQKIKTMTFGMGEEADLRISQISTTTEHLQFNCTLKPHTAYDESGQYVVTLSVLGEHNAYNATGAIAASLAAGCNMASCLQGLARFSGVSGRLNQVRIGQVTLLDDSYNANPASMKAGLSTLTSLPSFPIACLGAMGELGEHQDKAHKDVALFARQLGVKSLYIYGEDARVMVTAFGEGAQWFATHEDLVQALNQQLKALSTPVTILIKGSRSAQMDVVATQLTQLLHTKGSVEC